MENASRQPHILFGSPNSNLRSKSQPQPNLLPILFIGLAGRSSRAKPTDAARYKYQPVTFARPPEGFTTAAHSRPSEPHESPPTNTSHSTIWPEPVNITLLQPKSSSPNVSTQLCCIAIGRPQSTSDPRAPLQGVDLMSASLAHVLDVHP